MRTLSMWSVNTVNTGNGNMHQMKWNEWKAIKDKSFWHDIRFSLQRGRHKANANALGFMDEMDKPKTNESPDNRINRNFQQQHNHIRTEQIGSVKNALILQ